MAICTSLFVVAAGLAATAQAQPADAQSAQTQEALTGPSLQQPPADVPPAPAVPAGTVPAAAVPSDAVPHSPEAEVPATAAAQAPAGSNDKIGAKVGAPAAAHDEIGAAQLPHDLSPWGMFLAADIVVKGIMAGLAVASVLTWTIWFAKSVELFFARRRLQQDARRIFGAKSLADGVEKLAGSQGLVARLIENARLELTLSGDVLAKAGAAERVASRLDGLVAMSHRSMNRGTGVLATIGSTAPFVGLFGTVWGIMNSFIGISKSQTTNLAVVAPGIAEALLATAIGLVAAIPAVIIYNQFARSIGAYKAVAAEAAAEVERLVSRDLDRGVAMQLPARTE